MRIIFLSHEISNRTHTKHVLLGDKLESVKFANCATELISVLL